MKDIYVEHCKIQNFNMSKKNMYNYFRKNFKEIFLNF